MASNRASRMAIDKLIQRKHIEDSLKQEFEQTFPIRVARWLQMKPHWIKPYTHFAVVSSECSLLFRDGYFYACIALIQAVAEATTRFLCQKSSWRPGKNFEGNVKKLAQRNIISGRLEESLLKIWEKRDDYHHLNSTVKIDRQKLEKLAREKVHLLAKVEGEIFNITVTGDGKIVPEKPKYWK